jgi:DUF1680 family protein
MTDPISGPVDTAHSPFARLHPLPFNHLRLAGGFWGARQELNHAVTLPHGYRMLELHHRFHNFRSAASNPPGDFRGLRFNDSDAYKWLEGVAWELGRQPSPELSAMAAEAVDWIAAAQQPDGYINTYIQLKNLPRWGNITDDHELYCLGHLIQAAVALARTQPGPLSEKLLGVACRGADCAGQAFGWGRREIACGHPEVETALVELYRQTGVHAYLDLGQFFIDVRGRKQLKSPWGGPDYFQDHLPVRENFAATGHAVRQMYLAAGATDVYLETGDPALWAAMRALWDNMTGARMYITGGIGARHSGEAFGEDYELPTDTCYCETCAAIASAMWSWRMYLASGEARYADLLERTLYNAVLPGWSLDGSHFFYVNPLMVRDAAHAGFDWGFAGDVGSRPEWYECACCPPNVMRLAASLSHYFVSQRVPAAGENAIPAIQVLMYAPFDLDTTLPGGNLAVRAETNYPWDGRVRLEIRSTPAQPWSLELRLPAWATGYSLILNGQDLNLQANSQGFLCLAGAWQPGDIVELNLPMGPYLVESNPRVDATRGCAALAYGPLVYCLEGRDQPQGVNLLDVALDPNAALACEWRPEELGGVLAITAAGSHRPLGFADAADLGGPRTGPPFRRIPNDTGNSASPEDRPIRLTALPYFAWGSRGLSEMRVWVPVRTR